MIGNTEDILVGDSPMRASCNQDRNLERIYRRRRKAGSGDTTLLKIHRRVPSTILFVFCAMSWVGAYSFLSIPTARFVSKTPTTSCTTTRTAASRLQHFSPCRPKSLCHPRLMNDFALCANTGNGDTAPDEEEWQAMLAAFKIYKMAFGDLKVPLRFVVPPLAPWPEKAWNMKLGQKVTAIRSTGKYVSDERRRKVLEDMGFLWRLRAASTTKDKDEKGPSPSFDQIYTALATYRELHKSDGPLDIPSSFEVPDCDPWPQSVRGLPLGKKMATIRSKSFLAANPGAKEKLKALGLQVGGKVAANDERFQIVFDALKRYQEIHGDLHIPQPFVVPEGSKDWPEQTWGLRLGARVNAIRSQGTFVNANPERKKLLDDLGFVWVPAEGGNRRGRRRKEESEAMEGGQKVEKSSQRDEGDLPPDNSLESLFGDSFFGDDSMMGGDSETDAPQWGLEGGSFDEATRKAEEEAQAAEEYTPPKNLEETLAEAAERAADVGIIERMGPEKRIIKGKREKDIPWFNDDFGGEFVFDDVVEALTVYKSIYGDFSNLTDGTFVVPSRSDDEFADLDGAMGTFGYDDANARGAAVMSTFEARRRAVAEGNSLDGEMEELSDETDSLESQGSRLSEGSPEDWPEHLGGMLLGHIVKRIRSGALEVKHLPERKKRLDDLDFDWGDPDLFIDVPFEKAMCAMYAYYLVRGDMFVPEDFVMPDSDPWPQALAGFEIGKAVRRIRELQYFFEEYHNEKMALLRMVEFVWFSELALPLDPNEPEWTYELYKLRSDGHPDMKIQFLGEYEVNTTLRDMILANPQDVAPFRREYWRRHHNWELVKDLWYEKGRRDNAWYLRATGYPMMGDEHEAKYGPGLFTRINETLTELEDGIDGISNDDRLGLLEKVKYYRKEMEDCSDLQIHIKDENYWGGFTYTVVGFITRLKLNEEGMRNERKEFLKSFFKEEKEYAMDRARWYDLVPPKPDLLEILDDRIYLLSDGLEGRKAGDKSKEQEELEAKGLEREYQYEEIKAEYDEGEVAEDEEYEDDADLSEDDEEYDEEYDEEVDFTEDSEDDEDEDDLTEDEDDGDLIEEEYDSSFM